VYLYVNNLQNVKPLAKYIMQYHKIPSVLAHINCALHPWYQQSCCHRRYNVYG